MTPGSANINQRSLAGSRDTELAVVLHQVHLLLENNYHRHIETETKLSSVSSRCSSLKLARAHLADSIGTAEATAPGRPCKVFYTLVDLSTQHTMAGPSANF